MLKRKRNEKGENTAAGPVPADQANPVSACRHKNGSGILHKTAPALLTVLSVTAVCILTLLLFLYGLNQNLDLPALGMISAYSLGIILGSRLSAAAGLMVVVLLFILLFASCRRRIRKAFLLTAVSFFVCVLLILLTVIFSGPVFNALSPDWQQALVSSRQVYQSFALLCALILAVAAAAFLSVYFCIAAAKGAGYEKTA